MPVRLNVIMIESAPVGGAARRLAEAVVGELIGLAGVDLTLVDSLANVDATSTDKLTLDGITGDVCVLDWQSPDVIASSLQSIEFPGRRFPHPHDLEAATGFDQTATGTDRMGAGSQNPLRRIYAFDLSRFADASQLCEALRDLRASREVRTFSLVSPPGAAATASPATGLMKTAPMALATGVDGTDVASVRPAANAVGSPKPTLSSAHPAPASPSELPRVDLAADPAVSVPDSPGTRGQRSAAESSAHTNGSGAIDLDELVDQLDEFDP